MFEMSKDSVQVFFYGSYMDSETLAGWKVKPIEFEVARLDDYELAFCPFATLIPKKGSAVHGVLARLYREDVERLYSRVELADYKAVDVILETEKRKRVRASCFIAKPRKGMTPSPEYLQLLIKVAEKLCFPSDYVERMKRYQA